MNRERRHVVHIVGTLQSGGVQSWILGFASSPALAPDRHSVICVYGKQGELVPTFESAGIRVHSCRFPWPDSLPLPSYRAARWVRQRLQFTFPRRLARLLRKLEADIVHTHVTSRIDLQAVGVLEKASLPWVWTIHGRYRPEREERERWARAARLAARGRGRVTAVAEALAEDFVEQGIGPRSQVEVVYGGADIQRFRNGGSRDPGVRARLGIPADAVLFGSAGRLVPEKAYEIFVRAAALLRPRGVPAAFAIAGKGPREREIAAEVERLGMGDRFHLVGYQEDMPSFLKQLDVFVLSSRSEGFPLALIEALASGLPCIATSVGGIPELLGEEDGVIVPPESPEALVRAMEEMFSASARARYARAGPAIAGRFTYDACAGRFSSIYSSLLP